MNSYFFQDRVVLLQLQALGVVLLVLDRNITAGAGLAAVFVLGALQDHLYAVTFLCHDESFKSFLLRLLSDMLTFRPQLLYHRIQTLLVDGADSLGGNLEGHPLIFFGQVEALGLQVGQKTTLGLDIGVRNFVASNGRLTGYLTYSCHDQMNFWEGKGKGKMLIIMGEWTFFLPIC